MEEKVAEGGGHPRRTGHEGEGKLRQERNSCRGEGLGRKG